LTASRGAAAPPGATVRIDKWLWAARFYKTRSLASGAVHAGHVKVDGEAVKAARSLRAGELIDLAIGEAQWTVKVIGLSEKRGPASVARTLYEETAESSARREAAKEKARFAPNPGSDLAGRPTKKARRQIRRFNEGF
jgi:ribosome-associated heat shock protein Hsp15